MFLQRRREPAVIFLARDFLHPELADVLVHELGVEQQIALFPQPRRKIDQRDLAGIGAHGKHALAEKGRSDRNAIDAARQNVAVPCLDAMRVPLFVKLRIEPDDPVIDPCFLARIGAGGDDLFERRIESDFIRLLADGAAQAPGHMHAIQGQYAPRWRVIPGDILRLPCLRHREDAHAIGLQHHFRRQLVFLVTQGFSPFSASATRRQGAIRLSSPAHHHRQSPRRPAHSPCAHKAAAPRHRTHRGPR